jgi:uncharacterized protein
MSDLPERPPRPTPEGPARPDQASAVQPSHLTLSEVRLRLREYQTGWQALGVSRVRIFGSVAREEASAGSDIDVLLDFREPAGLIALARAQEYFEHLLGRRTDSVTQAGLLPALRGAVMQDAVDALGDEVAPRPGPARRWRWRLERLTLAASRVHGLVQTRSEADFLADPLAQDAALLNLLRLGEGTKFVPQAVQDSHPAVPWQALRGMRNLIAHDYFGLDPAMIYATAAHELPALLLALAALLEQEGLEAGGDLPSEWPNGQPDE